MFAVSPEGHELAVSMACDDPARSGLYIFDLNTGTSRRVLDGATAAFSWSPDGRRLAVGVAPTPSAGSKQVIEIIDPDSGRHGVVVSAGAGWPTWAPAT